jgi:hypothetical protein
LSGQRPEKSASSIFGHPAIFERPPFRKGPHQAVIDDLSRLFLHFS